MGFTMKDFVNRLDAAMKGTLDTTALGTAALNAQQFSRYVRAMQYKTRVLPEARLIEMAAEKQDIDTVGFSGRIAKAPAAEGSAATSFSEPTFSKQQLSAAEVWADTKYTDKMLRRNIEKQNFEQTLLDLIGQQFGLDMEELGIRGDTGSSDSFLALTDGWLKQAGRNVLASGHDSLDDISNDYKQETKAGVADGATVTLDWSAFVPFIKYNTTGYFKIGDDAYPLSGSPTNELARDDGNGNIVEISSSGITGVIDYESGQISITNGSGSSADLYCEVKVDTFDKTANTYPENMFERQLLVVPKNFFQDPSEWRFYVPWSVLNAYHNLLSSRGTPLGDEVKLGTRPLTYKSVPVKAVAKMPENRSWLTHPNENTAWGIFHEMKIEGNRKPEERSNYFHTTAEMDFGYAFPKAANVAKI